MLIWENIVEKKSDKKNSPFIVYSYIQNWIATSISLHIFHISATFDKICHAFGYEFNLTYRYYFVTISGISRIRQKHIEEELYIENRWENVNFISKCRRWRWILLHCYSKNIFFNTVNKSWNMGNITNRHF